MKFLTFYIIAFFFGLSTFGQSEPIHLKVISGNKLIFSEEGKLEQIFREHFTSRERELQDRIAEVIGKSMKFYTKQGLRDMNILLGRPVFSVSNERNDLKLNITIPGNKVSYYITTPDYFGIGKDRSEDPFISFTYTIIGSLTINQNGEAESIEFTSPYWWNWKVNENNSKKLQSFNYGKSTGYEIMDNEIVNMVQKIMFLFSLVNEVKDKFNYYLDKKIVRGKSLQKEFSIDNTTQVFLSIEGEKTLVFKHEYSSAGIVKRSSSTDASVINKKVNIPSTIPTTTYASDINKKPPTYKAPPKLPNSSKPIDLKKGPSGAKKNKVPKL